MVLASLKFLSKQKCRCLVRGVRISCMVVYPTVFRDSFDCACRCCPLKMNSESRDTRQVLTWESVWLRNAKQRQFWWARPNTQLQLLHNSWPIRAPAAALWVRLNSNLILLNWSELPVYVGWWDIIPGYERWSHGSEVNRVQTLLCSVCSYSSCQPAVSRSQSDILWIQTAGAHKLVRTATFTQNELKLRIKVNELYLVEVSGNDSS